MRSDDQGDALTYTFGTNTTGTFEHVVEKVENALANEGFGVLTRIDVQATLKEKLDVDLPPYVILGACNPPLAHGALSVEPRIGALLPCNVVIRGFDDAEGFAVDFMDPAAVLELVASDEIEHIAGEVKARLQRVCAAVA